MSPNKEENHETVAVSPVKGNNQPVEEEEEEIELLMPEPPDGGWGWVVVFCSFMIHVIVDGVTYTFGIFYLEFLRYFGESKGATSWVASIMVGTTFCVGPFASGLTNQFGCRTVTIIGAILAAFGLVVSILAPNITFLYFSVGLCTGTGFGLIYLPAIVCVTCYFEKKRAFATGIAVCGSGIGTSILAPLVELLVKELGWRGAMVITAGLVLSCCFFGAFFRPLEKKPQVVRRMTNGSIAATSPSLPAIKDLRKGSLPNGTIGTNGEICLAPLKVENLKMHSSSLLGINNHSKQSPLHEIRNATSMTLSCGTTSSRRSSLHLRGGPLARKDIFYSGNIPQNSSNLYMYDVKEDVEQEVVNVSMKSRIINCLCPAVMIEAFREMMNFKLMTNIIFLMFGLSNFFTNIGFNVPYVYTKDRAIGLNIANETYASFLISIIGIANTIGRVVLGYLSDRSFINRLWLYNGSLALCGFATAFSSFCLSYEWMAVYAAVFGATSGAYVSLTSVILVDLLGLEKLTNAFGLLLLFEGVACLIGPPITGWLYDFTGSYDPGFYASGTMIAISGLMLFFIPCVQRLLEEREKKKERVPSIDVSSANAV
ncbi:monocarboxylate transporter 14-like [Argiope bruennichi]|uniref:monocarboxylate transporter 14-like n=1 Tax=Argiope bruennichi TaxID=94029 RepID=UPI0024943427|nr:monocarboxylate transporter 14-like [Argiope bruennichi]XP_055939892.1 monocarboxylate transporter 14-like [Argiope bruennichi]